MNRESLEQHITDLRHRQQAAAEPLEQLAITRLLDAYTSLQSRLAGRRASPSRADARRRASADAMGLRTSLENCRQVTISISQLFRINDLLTQPSGVRATNLAAMVNDVGKFRRSLNPNAKIEIEGLGRLEPVARIGQSRDRNSFWSPALPDLRDPAFAVEPPLVMVPFEISPFPPVESVKLAPELWVEDLVKDTLGPATQDVKISSVRGSLRLYPTGVGVVRLTTDLEFGGPILVELIAHVARAIEDTVFIDADGKSKRAESFLADLVDGVAASLLTDAGEHDRRWRPPDTIIRFRQGAFVPEDHLSELAYAMSLSSGNRETMLSLRSRIEKKLRSTAWIEEGVLAVPGHRVLMLVRSIDARHKGDAANRLLKFLAETHELTTVALHTYRVFGEDLAALHENGWPDDKWLPDSENYPRLTLLVDTILRAVRAVWTIQGHLKRTGRGTLTVMARELWDANAQKVVSKLEEELRHVSQWIESSGYGGDMVALTRTINAIVSTKRPFNIRETPTDSIATDAEESLENDILDGLQQIEGLLAGDTSEFQQIDAAILRVDEARRRLFAPLN